MRNVRTRRRAVAPSQHPCRPVRNRLKLDHARQGESAGYNEPMTLESRPGVRSIWQDPVWSKVIASFVIGVTSLFLEPVRSFLLGKNNIANWVTVLLCLIGLFEGAILLRSLGRPRLTEEKNQPGVQITLPRPGEIMSDKQPFGMSSSYVVRGRLTSLPESHQIWLLTSDGRPDRFWPQGFYPVQFDPRTGDWHGRVHGKTSPLQVFAVVAPPTSQDLFHYYQRRGEETGTFTPLPRVPPECKNLDSVQAIVQ